MEQPAGSNRNIADDREPRPISGSMENFLPNELTAVTFKINKYGLTGGAIAGVSVLFLICVYFFYGRSTVDSPPASPYNLSSHEIELLKGQATQGDCEAARSLARYYFDVALSLKGGTEWQRVAAANCPDEGSKVDLAWLLIHYKTDSASDKEIADLIERIRATNPARAAELEDELKK
jgi:hypothetical protein